MNWKPIKFYEGFYEVSDTGDIRSLDRVVSSAKSLSNLLDIQGQEIKSFDNGEGYIQVKLRDFYGVRKSHYVHRLVYTAFVGEIPEDMEVHHIDFNKENNSVLNLCLVSRRENVLATSVYRPDNYSCSLCKVPVSKNSNLCLQCHNLNKRVAKRPSKETLKRELLETNFSSVGRKYGVSDNAIRKWCISYGLSSKAKDYR